MAAFLLAFREGVEAALILGIVLGVLSKLDRADLKTMVWFGAGLAFITSLLVGLGFYFLGISFEGTAEQAFEGIAMLLAAGVLTWMIYWMRRQGGSIHQQLESDAKHATGNRGRWTLFFLAFMAVLREGVELALFLTAAAFAISTESTLVGGILGLLAAVVAGWFLFSTTSQLKISMFFRVSSLILIVFAAGLVAHGVHEFNEVGWIPPVLEHVWNLNPILDENSGAGEFLKTLVGYNGNPSLSEVIAYIGYWFFIYISLFNRRTRNKLVVAGK